MSGPTRLGFLADLCAPSLPTEEAYSWLVAPILTPKRPSTADRLRRDCGAEPNHLREIRDPHRWLHDLFH